MYVDSCGSSNTRLGTLVFGMKIGKPRDKSISAFTTCLTLVSRSIPLSLGVNVHFRQLQSQEKTSCFASLKNLYFQSELITVDFNPPQ